MFSRHTSPRKRYRRSRTSTTWSEKASKDILSHKHSEKSPFTIATSPCKSSIITTPSIIRSITKKQQFQDMNRRKTSRYGSSTALLVTDRVVHSAPDLLPLSFKFSLDRQKRKNKSQDLEKKILIPTLIPLPDLETAIVPNPRPAITPHQESIDVSGSQSILLPTSSSSLPYQHYDNKLMKFFSNRNEMQRSVQRSANRAYREKMIEHRLHEISLTRTTVRQQNATWENTLRLRTPRNIDDDEDDEDDNVVAALTNDDASKRLKALNYSYLPGTQKLVKKNMFTNSYKLNEYWRQIEVQRAMGITKHMNSKKKTTKIPAKKISRSRSLSASSYSPPPRHTAGNEEDEKEIDEDKGSRYPTPETMPEVKSMLDLLMHVVWRIENMMKLFAWTKLQNNVMVVRLKEILNFLIHSKVKKAWMKWIAVNRYLKKRNFRQMKRALSITQVNSEAWKRTLIKQLILKKICFTLKVVKIREGFATWKLNTSMDDKKQKRDTLLQRAVSYQPLRKHSNNKNKDRSNTCSSNRIRDRTTSSGSMRSVTSRGSLKKYNKRGRRMSLLERAPRQMLEAMSIVQEKKSFHVYKNTGLSANELLDYAMGVRKKNKRNHWGKSKGIDQEEQGELLGTRKLPSQTYFFKRAKEQDLRFRPKQVESAAGRCWYR